MPYKRTVQWTRTWMMIPMTDSREFLCCYPPPNGPDFSLFQRTSVIALSRDLIVGGQSWF